MSAKRQPDERRHKRPKADHGTYIGANQGWDVVWVGTERPYTLYRHEVVAWRIGTHQRVVPITVDDVPSDYAIEHLGRLYEPAVERGVPSRIYNKVDEYHQARIGIIEAKAADADMAVIQLRLREEAALAKRNRRRRDKAAQYAKVARRKIKQSKKARRQRA